MDNAFSFETIDLRSNPTRILLTLFYFLFFFLSFYLLICFTFCLFSNVWHTWPFIHAFSVKVSLFSLFPFFQDMRQRTVTPKIRTRCPSIFSSIRSNYTQVNTTHGSLTVGVTGKSVGHFLDLVRSPLVVTRIWVSGPTCCTFTFTLVLKISLSQNRFFFWKPGYLKVRTEVWRNSRNLRFSVKNA